MDENALPEDQKGEVIAEQEDVTEVTSGNVEVPQQRDAGNVDSIEENQEDDLESKVSIVVEEQTNQPDQHEGEQNESKNEETEVDQNASMKSPENIKSNEADQSNVNPEINVNGDEENIEVGIDKNTEVNIDSRGNNDENIEVIDNADVIENGEVDKDIEVVVASEDTAIINEIDGIINEDTTPIETKELEELDANATPPPPTLKFDSAVPFDEEILEEDEYDEVAQIKQDVELDEEYAIYDREQLLQQYKDALDERSKVQSLNQQYQHKLAEYFKKKKTDDRGQEIEKNVSDQEQRYLKYMSNLEELQAAEARQAGSIEIQLGELKGRCEDKLERVEEAAGALMKFKYEVAKTAINSRSGKTITAKDIEQYQAFEAKKEQEVIAVRLENIKLKNRLKKREMQLKAKEELAEGLHLIDFEQLKIENQTYNEKIEERNEELLKLRKKITTTVQVLTHLKEKLQFVQGENGEQRSKLRDIEVTVAQRRDVLTRIKQVRDGLRIDNNKLKHKSGLLGNTALLRDFEVRKDEGEDLRMRLKTLKESHIQLNMNLNGIRKKIEKSNSVNTTA